MGKECRIEIAGLPVLTSCPAEDEYLMFMNTAGGFGQYGYSLRSWRTVKNCLVISAFFPDYLQVEIGVNITSYNLVPPTGWEILEDSVWVGLSGAELQRGVLLDRLTYDRVYNNDGSVSVNFYNDGNPLPEGQYLQFHFIRRKKSA